MQSFRVPSFSFFNRPAVLLIPLMAVGAYLRLKGLTFQSLWIDEIHTMIESAPLNNAKHVIALVIHSDPHPPFYFLLIHYWFQLFGYNDYSARLPSAIVGVLTIPSMYFLGRELYSKSVGYISAVFTTFNYYNIYYSQEARGYILAFLLTTLSFLFFSKTVRGRSWKAAGLYVVFTSLLVYTHYYGLLIFCCQLLILFILILTTRDFKSLLLHVGVPCLLVILIYSPWIPPMVDRAVNQIKFWIAKPDVTFIGSFFAEYFGKDPFTICLFVILLIVFLTVGILKKTKDESGHPITDGFKFTLLVLGIWILGSYLIPYVKSVISMPILSPRYTIVTLPAILIAAAIGTEFLFYRAAKACVVGLVVLFSLLHLFVLGHYYERPTKIQWREMAMFLQKENQHNLPIISDRQWHLAYYFSIFHVTPRYVEQDKVMRLHRFWVVTAHHGNPISPETKAILDHDFTVKKSFRSAGCYAILYAKKRLPVSRE